MSWFDVNLTFDFAEVTMILSLVQAIYGTL